MCHSLCANLVPRLTRHLKNVIQCCKMVPESVSCLFVLYVSLCVTGDPSQSALCYQFDNTVHDTHLQSLQMARLDAAPPVVHIFFGSCCNRPGVTVIVQGCSISMISLITHKVSNLSAQRATSETSLPKLNAKSPLFKVSRPQIRYRRCTSHV